MFRALFYSILIMSSNYIAHVLYLAVLNCRIQHIVFFSIRMKSSATALIAHD